MLEPALLVLAITLHNVPEGLAIGVAFGAVAAGYESATLGAAVALAVGIGIQNCPEGTAIAVPLRREGLSRAKAWWYGQMSAAVEPVAAVVGALAVTMMRPILPYALAFAAGAMIFVVVEEVIPESQSGGHSDLATLGARRPMNLRVRAPNRLTACCCEADPAGIVALRQSSGPLVVAGQHGRGQRMLTKCAVQIFAAMAMEAERRHIHSVQREPVSMHAMTAWGARPAVSRLAEAVLQCLCDVASHCATVQGDVRRGKVIEEPVRERGTGRVWIVHDECKAARGLRRS